MVCWSQAVRTDGLALVHASEDLRDDEDFAEGNVYLQTPILTMPFQPFSQAGSTRFLCQAGAIAIDFSAKSEGAANMGVEKL